jgi:hypothetical protein
MKKIKIILSWILIAASILLVWTWIDYGVLNKFDVLKPIVEGVFGGVVTAILLFVFGTLWKSSITPWFENITYKDAKIEGVWHGVLVPYIGIEEIDRLRAQAAWRSLMSKAKQPKTKSAEDAIPVGASMLDKDGERTTASAELIIPAKVNSAEGMNIGRSSEQRKISITIPVVPIKVRAEFWRVGHNIKGRLIEIGGASDVHTYFIEGNFRNLIVSGCYENENRQNIDRGSFSLMLRSNGEKFEGFFASYADQEHKIRPFSCVLKRNIDAGNVAV